MSPVDEQWRIRAIRRRLLGWGRISRRQFWWRDQRDPFVTAIIEVLLKQTRASAVEMEAKRFLALYPDPEALAGATEGQLARDLKPFGFHRQRSAHLKALGTALALGERSISPDRDNLLSLPGIGPYAASAIRCFVYGISEPVIDVNVVRIVERAFGITYERGEGRRNKEVQRVAAALLRGRRPREVNWTLLDLGALVCRQRNPLCNECPLSRVCLHRTEGVAA